MGSPASATSARTGCRRSISPTSWSGPRKPTTSSRPRRSSRATTPTYSASARPRRHGAHASTNSPPTSAWTGRVTTPSSARRCSTTGARRTRDWRTCSRSAEFASRPASLIRATFPSDPRTQLGRRPHFLFDPLGVLDFRHSQVIRRLQVQPRARVPPEVAGQAHGGIGGHAAAPAHHVVDARSRHRQCLGQRVGAHAQRDEEVFAQHLARVDRSHAVLVHLLPFLSGNRRSPLIVKHWGVLKRTSPSWGHAPPSPLSWRRETGLARSSQQV